MTQALAPMAASAWARRIVTALAIVSAIAACYATRQADPDLFGYLAYGRLFVQQGDPSPADPFAFTSQGRRWISFEYLSQALLWLAYERFGALGLIALKCALGGMALAFLFTAVRKASDDPVVWAPIFVFCAVTLARYFAFRPQLFTFVFFAMFVAAVFGHLIIGKARWWVLPLASLIWANTHGGFVAGLCALALAIALVPCRQFNNGNTARRTVVTSIRPLAFTLAACAVASLINPHGVRLWSYVVTEITHDTNRRYISEWRPASPGNDPWSFGAITILTIVLMGSGGIAQRHRLKVAGLHPWQWVAASVPIVGAAYLSVRNVPLAAIWLAPVLTLLGSAMSRSTAVAAFRRLWLLVSVGAVVVVTLVLQFIAAQPRPQIAMGGQAPGTQYPCGAVAFLRLNALQGTVYNPLQWGSYLTWELFPAVLVSMDGRNISLFSQSMVSENLEFYSPAASQRDLDAVAIYRSDFLLVPTDRAVLGIVQADSRWSLIHADHAAQLFVRSDFTHGTLRIPSSAACPEVLVP